MIVAVNVGLDPKWAPCGECGCVDGKAGYDRWEIPGVLKSRVCPRRLVTPESSDWIALHAHYKAGFLASDGGILDQPNAYLEAMRLIDHWIAKDGTRPQS